MGFHVPTTQELEEARGAFEINEPRDLFYRAATELVKLTLQGVTSLNVTEALAVLLQTRNKAFYRYNKFDSSTFLTSSTLSIATGKPSQISDSDP